MDHTFNYEVEDCDVADKASLRDYRARLKMWAAILDRQGVQSIGIQIASMLKHDATYRVLNTIGLQQQEAARPGALQNYLLFHQLHYGYLAVQCLAIRRLTDKNTIANKAVLSLHRVLEEMRQSHTLFTRENFVCFDGLRFDREEAAHNFMRENSGRRGGWGSTNGGAADPHRTCDEHDRFDRLLGCSSGSRNRADVLPKALFEAQLAKLKCSQIKNIRDYTNKVIAHTDEKVTFDPPGLSVDISMDSIEVAHRTICEVYDFAALAVLGRGPSNWTVISCEDWFQNWCEPICSDFDMEVVRQKWEALMARYPDWTYKG